MALHAYLTGEIANDYADGLLSRREALRRLGLLGLTATSAVALLGACSSNDSGTVKTKATTATTTTTTSAGPPGKAGALTASAITFDGPAGTVHASFAAPAGTPKGAVLVVHENKGLTPHFFDVPGRFAGIGYAALVVDLLSRQGGTPKVGDEAAAQAALGKAPVDDLLADLRAGIDELQRRVPNTNIGAVGFCFGGGMLWNLLDAGESRLAAAVPFYGPSPDKPDFSNARAAVLAIYGGDDTFVNPTRDKAINALIAAHLTYDVKIYPGAGHAFFNDTGTRFNADAAAGAWSAVQDWFAKYLAT